MAVGGDVGNQVFNKQDLFSGKAVAEDGPPVEANKDVDAAPVFDFDGNCEALLCELFPSPANSSAAATPQAKAKVAKDAAHGSAPRRSNFHRAGSRADASEAKDSHQEKSSASSETKPRKSAKSKRMKLRMQRDMVLYWLETKYDVLQEVIQAISEEWQEASGPDDDMDLLWSDHAISVDRFIKMQSYQKVNHFVGMTSITRKNNLGRNLLRMKKRFPEEYRFFPDTWILPTDLSDFKAQFNGKKNKTFIVKPSDGYQGKGIFLTRDYESIPLDYNTTVVVQRYIHKPWLLDGHKFDLRLYVLVTGCDPLRIFLHEHGLVRLASEEYIEPKGKNLQRTMMHLTNYAINCDNPNFEENANPEDGSDGHKRSLQAVLREFEDEGVDVPALMVEIEDLVVKTLIAVQPSLSHVYHSCQPDDLDNAMCFEILGFDVLLDCKAKPWLIEVNHAPSFRTETPLDRLVKFQALSDAFELLHITPENRRRYKRDQQKAVEERARGEGQRRSLEERQSLEEDLSRARDDWENSIKNGYRRVYPSDGRALDYDRYLEAAIDIWETLTGSNSRRVNKKKEAEDESKNRRVSSEDAGRVRNRARRQTHTSMDRGRSGAGEGAAVAKSVPADSSRRSRSAEKLNLTGVGSIGLGPKSSPPATATALPGVGVLPKPSPPQPPPARVVPEMEVGDVIQVQTNMGWESVTVMRKHETGQLDIKFEDGELMKQVMPRILKKANGSPAVSQSAHLPSASHPSRPSSAHGNDGLHHHGEHRQGTRSPPVPPPPPSRPSPTGSGGSSSSASRGNAVGSPQRPLNASSSAYVPPSMASASTAATPERGFGRAATNELGSYGASASSSSPTGLGGNPAGASSPSSSLASTIANSGGRSPMPGSDRWSSLRPPPRLPGTIPAREDGASGERSGSAGPETGLQSSSEGSSCDPQRRWKLKQALRDESLHRLRQKLLQENGSSALDSAGRRTTPVHDVAEARKANGRAARQRPNAVRPLLPPKGPGWSSVSGSANMVQRPALTIEAHGVHPPISGASRGSRAVAAAAAEQSAEQGGSSPALSAGASQLAAQQQAAAERSEHTRKSL